VATRLVTSANERENRPVKIIILHQNKLIAKNLQVCFSYLSAGLSFLKNKRYQDSTLPPPTKSKKKEKRKQKKMDGRQKAARVCATFRCTVELGYNAPRI